MYFPNYSQHRSYLLLQHCLPSPYKNIAFVSQELLLTLQNNCSDLKVPKYKNLTTYNN